MDKLADMIESALKRYDSKNIRTMLDSEDWRDIQARYNEVRTELLVQGQVELLHRIEAGHDKLQDKLAELACQDDPPNLKDVYLFWDLPFCATLRAMASIRPQLQANSRVQASKDLPKPKASADPPKRSWTQPDLENARREWQSAIEDARNRRQQSEANDAGPGELDSADDIIAQANAALAGMGDLLADQAAKIGSQGTFVAANVLGLQAGSVTDRMANGIDRIERNTRSLRDAEGISFQ